MNKASITRLYVGSAIAVGAGGVLLVAAIALAVWNDVFAMAGPDITGIHGSVGAWVLIAFAIAGALAIAGGLVGGFASWIGALVLTWQRDTRTWFAVLVLLGIFNLGFFGMIAYLVAGPDRTDRAVGPVAAGSVA